MSNDAFGYDPKIPEAIRDIFMWLCQDAASLRYKWGFYLELFGSIENVDLLSELAPASFQIIEESLRDDMTMAICRLSDPIQSMGKDNLSLTVLVHQLGELDEATSEMVKKSLEDFREACKPVQLHRNKRVGHNDLNTTIKPHDNPLPGIGRKDIDRILQLAEQTLNLIYQRFVDSELSFAPIHRGGAGDLVFWLRTAKEYESTRRSAFLGGPA